MNEMIFCQSCAMPLQKDEDFGTDKGGGKNTDYCVYCYKDGAFLQDVSMDEMIDISLKHMKEIFKNDPNFSEENALNDMKKFFPGLNRWK